MTKPLNERIASVETSLRMVLDRMDEDREEHREGRKAAEGYLRRIEENQETALNAVSTRVTSLEASRHKVLGMRDLIVAGVSVLASLGITLKINT
jgi:hypothetical protein